jgi:hypothetical protein
MMRMQKQQGNLECCGGDQMLLLCVICWVLLMLGCCSRLLLRGVHRMRSRLCKGAAAAVLSTKHSLEQLSVDRSGLSSLLLVATAVLLLS